MADPATILIASPLEEHVARLRALAPGRLQVLHDPALLSAPRFAGDHQGVPLQRTPAQHPAWAAMLVQADILRDLPAAAGLPHLRRLRWCRRQAPASALRCGGWGWCRPACEMRP